MIFLTFYSYFTTLIWRSLFTMMFRCCVFWWKTNFARVSTYAIVWRFGDSLLCGANQAKFVEISQILLKLDSIPIRTLCLFIFNYTLLLPNQSINSKKYCYQNPELKATKTRRKCVPKTRYNLDIVRTRWHYAEMAELTEWPNTNAERLYQTKRNVLEIKK